MQSLGQRYYLVKNHPMRNPALPNIAISAIIGGTISKVTGGNFANGAATAAMATIFRPDGKPISKKDADLAQLAGCSYRGLCKNDTGFDEVSPESIGLDSGRFTDPDSGFKATLFKRGNEFVLGFGGTDGLDAPDIKTDLAQSLGIDTEQYNLAIKLADQVQIAVASIEGSTLVFTGHSLGGGLASAAAIATQLPAVTFNSAGLSNRYGGGSLSAKSLIRAYYSKSDLLSLIQDITPLPDAAGTRIPLNAIGVHQITGVCQAMGVQC